MRPHRSSLAGHHLVQGLVAEASLSIAGRARTHVLENLDAQLTLWRNSRSDADMFKHVSIARATPPRSHGLHLMAFPSCDDTPVNSETIRGFLLSAWQRIYLKTGQSLA